MVNIYSGHLEDGKQAAFQPDEDSAVAIYVESTDTDFATLMVRGTDRHILPGCLGCFFAPKGEDVVVKPSAKGSHYVIVFTRAGV